MKAGLLVDGLTAYPLQATYTGAISFTNGTDHVANTNPIYQAKPGSFQFLTIQEAGTFNVQISGSPGGIGGSQPLAYGFHTGLTEESVVTNTVESPANVTATQRWVLTGWQLLDDQDQPFVPGSGNSTQAVFTVTTNLHLTWNWTNQFYLDVTAGANGDVSGSGWMTNGLSVEISATPASGYVFNQWSGDVPVEDVFNNPLTLIMDRSRQVVASFASESAVSKNWAGGTGAWMTGSAWDPVGVPGPNDLVSVPSGQVLLAGLQQIGTFTLGEEAVLVFSNWTTRLEAEEIHISGMVTLPAAFTGAQMSNRVHFAGTDFTLHQGGVINTDASGFANENGAGKGITVSGWGGGAGYGGRGGHAVFSSGIASGGMVYGSDDEPLAPGSGGGGSGTHIGGFGGGAVRIDMTGTVTVNGLISANGGNGANAGGGGSGGGVYITAGTFGGNTNGLIQANGGNGNFYATAPSHTGGGGGGRIAVHYTSLSALPGVRFSSRRAGRSARLVDDYYPEPTDRLAPESGTLHFPDTALLDNVISTWNQAAVGMAGSVLFASTNRWTLGATTWSNSQFMIPAGSAWTVPGGLTLSTGSVSVAAGAEFSVTGGLTLTNGATLVVYAAPTNGTTAYGNLIDIGGFFSVGPGSWVYPFSHSTNGGSVLFRVGSLTVYSGGGFNADGRGYLRGSGPGKGALDTANVASGGGHGGRGGDSQFNAHTVAGGSTNGLAHAPAVPGSGGGDYPQWRGNAGGGLIWIDAAGEVAMGGTLTANGLNGISHGGGGSGGAIYLAGRRVRFLDGATLNANGGNAGGANSGAGGGGRIAVWQGVDAARRGPFSEATPGSIKVSTAWPLDVHGTVNVAPGTGGPYAGDDPKAPASGTIRYLSGSVGSVFMVR